MEEGADIEYSQIFYTRHSVEEQFLDSSHTPTCHLSCISGRVYRFSTPPVTPRHSRSHDLQRAHDGQNKPKVVAKWSRYIEKNKKVKTQLKVYFVRISKEKTKILQNFL